jgi:F0F1-type ATP synthase membrane subunit a
MGNEAHALKLRDYSVAEQGKIDPMHQFTIEPMFGTDHWQIAGYHIPFTNSSLWMAIATVVRFVFVAGGLKRQLVPGRWQMAVESFTGFVDGLLSANIGPVVSVHSYALMVAICALEILVAGIQAYVFALLTSLYINDAENLH